MSKNNQCLSFLISLLLIVTIPIGNTIASTEQEEKTLQVNNKSAMILENYSPESLQKEKISLEKAFERQVVLEDKIDQAVGKILARELNDKKLHNKAASIEKLQKIEAMRAITKVFDKPNKLTEKEKGLLTHYLLKYAPYAGDDTLMRQGQEIANQPVSNALVQAAAATYSRANAINYALKYALSYNTPTYPDLNLVGGDCTNFISQAMVAGGKTMADNWYIYKKNSNYPKPASITQLNNSWNLADPSPWISASQFETYFTSKLNDEMYDAAYVADNQAIIFEKPYYKGDVIQIVKKRYWWYEGFHTMMITAYVTGGNDFLLTYHTNDKKNVPLHNLAVQYRDGYKFKALE